MRSYLQKLQVEAPKTKDEVRGILLRRKLEQLQLKRDRLKVVQGRALSLMERVNYNNIRPALIFCSPQDRQVWEYMRNVVSSAPWTQRPGRCLYLFCVDGNSGGILGIVDLGSDMFVLSPRDRYIGWTQQRRLTFGGLRHIANLGTCVPVCPFGVLTGGKFMSVAVTSQGIVDVWDHRYGDKLAAISTTSLFGKSSQYNRLNEYEYLGNTNGGGIAHIDERGKALFKAFLKEVNFKTKYGTGSRGAGPAGGYDNTLNKLMSVCQVLDIDFDIFRSGQPRGVYLALLGDGALEFLRGERDTFEPQTRTQEEIADWWLDRWYSMRWPKKKDEVAAFDYDIYRVDNQIDMIRAGVV